MASSTVVEMQLNHYEASSTEACPGRHTVGSPG